ncbi:MAG: O-antigen ligase family protein, partial [Planctomycetes bacterium]|nr:O-antigen ligase family protein [Planctomycetota bacterium]
MIITPKIFGGVQPTFQVWLFTGVTAALFGCWLNLILMDRGTPVLLPLACLPLLLALGLGVLQSTPLGTDVHRLLSPQTDLLWRQLTDDQRPAERADSPGKSNRTLASGPSSDVVATAAAAPETEVHPISLYPASTRHDLLWLAMGVSMFLLGVLIFRSTQSHLAILWLTAVNGLALSFFGLVQQVSWNGLLFWSVPLTQGGRPFASFVNKNNAGGFLNLCLAAAIGLLVWYLGRSEEDYASRQSMSPWEHIAHAISRLNGRTLAALVVAVFIAAGILCSLSRGAVVAMAGATALTVLAIVVSRGLRGRAFSVIAVITLAALLIVGWIGQSDTVQRRLASLFREREVVMHQRLPHWQAGLRAASDFWPLGSGLGTYRYVYRLYQENPDQPWFYHAENQYLEALVEGGIVGLSLMLAMIVLMALACRRLLRQSPTSVAYAVGVAGLFALTSQAIASFFDFGLYLPANTLLFALLCGVVAGCAANLKTQQIHFRSASPSIRNLSAHLRVNAPAMAASAVALLGIAMCVGTSAAKRDASYEQVRQEARALLDATDRAPGS